MVCKATAVYAAVLFMEFRKLPPKDRQLIQVKQREVQYRVRSVASCKQALQGKACSAVMRLQAHV